MISGGADVITIGLGLGLGLNHPETITTLRSIEKMSSTKPTPGAKKIGDCWSKKLPQTDQIRTLMERLGFPGGSVVKNLLLIQET